MREFTQTGENQPDFIAFSSTGACEKAGEPC